ncbi:unnamed protein product, partial [Vitis vinifera]
MRSIPLKQKMGYVQFVRKEWGWILLAILQCNMEISLKYPFSLEFRRGGSNSTFSILRKELRDGNLQSIFGGSSRIVSSSNSEPDPLLSSFMYNAPVVVEPVVVQPDSSAEASVVKESSDEGFSERNIQKPQLSDKEQEEKARRCEFVQGLLLSTILEDSL